MWNYYFTDFKQHLFDDIDVNINGKIISFLLDHTPLSIDEISNLFIHDENLGVAEKSKSKTLKVNLLSVGTRGRSSKKHGILYCPKCLFNSPYFKKYYRLQTSLVCLDCKTVLRDCCACCSAPVSFKRCFTRNKGLKGNEYELVRCFHCGNWLAMIEGEGVEEGSIMMQYQYFIKDYILGISSNFNKYIETLLYVSQICLSNSQHDINQIKFHLLKLCNLSSWEIHPTPFYLSRISSRRHILPSIDNLLRSETEFKCFVEKNNLSRTNFDRRKKFPSWLNDYFIM
jgi:hypothetical protein